MTEAFVFSLSQWLILRYMIFVVDAWFIWTMTSIVIGHIFFSILDLALGLNASPLYEAGLVGLSYGTAQAICLYRMEPSWRLRFLSRVQRTPTCTG
jgi:hypothetical protein